MMLTTVNPAGSRARQVLVTSVHPLVVYLYDEGLARFATEPYDSRAVEMGLQLDRVCMHLTNVSAEPRSLGAVPCSFQDVSLSLCRSSHSARLI